MRVTFTYVTNSRLSSYSTISDTETKDKTPEESNKGQNEDTKQNAYIPNLKKNPLSSFSHFLPNHYLTNNKFSNLVSKRIIYISTPPLHLLYFSLILIPC